MKYYLDGEQIKASQALDYIMGYGEWHYDRAEIQACWDNQHEEESRDSLNMISGYHLEIIPC